MSSTREQLIDLLANQEGEYVSGQWISERLHISRTAVWKQMKQLEKDGYKFDAIQNKGYRLVTIPDKLSANTIQWGLKTEWLGKELLHYDCLDSTQTRANELAQRGARHGTVVIANKQSKGRGRLNRKWYSNTEAGIWLSLILKPELLPKEASQLTLLTATVLVDVIQELSGLKPSIKWPNDLLIEGKKVAGILTEMQAEHDRIHYIVIGIGFNLNQMENDVPIPIHQRATSLHIQSGVKFPRKEAIQLVLQTFEKQFEHYKETGFRFVKSCWESYGYKMNERIHYQTGNHQGSGIIRGLADDGALLIESQDHKLTPIYSAEIDWFES